jgi:hypothetical protein
MSNVDDEVRGHSQIQLIVSRVLIASLRVKYAAVRATLRQSISKTLRSTQPAAHSGSVGRPAGGGVQNAPPPRGRFRPATTTYRRQQESSVIGDFLVVSIGLVALLFIATRPVHDPRDYRGGAILDWEEDEPT